MTMRIATSVGTEPGEWSWRLRRDPKSGHRTYELVIQVESDGVEDGPANAANTPGLPLPGSVWAFMDDVDLWATCQGIVSVDPILTGEPNQFFKVTLLFSTDPTQRCHDNPVEDPILEPPVITFDFEKFTEEGTYYRKVEYWRGSPTGGGTLVSSYNGATRLLNSAWEQIHGPMAEWDADRMTVKIVQNVLDLELDLLAKLNNTVNEAPLWGLPARCIKFNRGPAQELYYGQCYKYYKRTLIFSINTYEDVNSGDIVSGFDRDLADEGAMVLSGKWTVVGTPPNSSFIWADERVGVNGPWPDPLNPNHFGRYKDRAGNPARTLLDGEGRPAGAILQTGTGTGTSSGNAEGVIHVEKYNESDLLQLGIPAILG